MALFRSGKKKDIIDLGERYRKQQERLANMHTENNQKFQGQTSQNQDSQSAFNFLGNLAQSSQGSQNSSEEYIDVGNIEDRRKRLVRRLMDMTNKLEELSNQIYHLQQRIEVLEQKMKTGY